jgi:hypothetical protein
MLQRGVCAKGICEPNSILTVLPPGQAKEETLTLIVTPQVLSGASLHQLAKLQCLLPHSSLRHPSHPSYPKRILPVYKMEYPHYEPTSYRYLNDPCRIVSAPCRLSCSERRLFAFDDLLHHLRRKRMLCLVWNARPLLV